MGDYASIEEMLAIKETTGTVKVRQGITACL
jgi:hypothetical protein